MAPANKSISLFLNCQFVLSLQIHFPCIAIRIFLIWSYYTLWAYIYLKTNKCWKLFHILYYISLIKSLHDFETSTLKCFTWPDQKKKKNSKNHCTIRCIIAKVIFINQFKWSIFILVSNHIKNHFNHRVYFSCI